jgi:D-threo-aldose 1-dehydrogenase
LNPFETVQLGRSAVSVTRLGLGTAPLGGLYAPVAHEDALRTIDAAWQAGVRFFDTAPLYGHGLAEVRLGEALATRPRDSYVLATKVGRLLRPVTNASVESAHYKGTPPVEPRFDFSYDGVMRSVEESLARLNRDRVDILHLHDPDDHYGAALGGAYRALSKLREEGVIGAIGAGMNQWRMLQRFAEDAEFDCFLLAGRFTLLDRSAEASLLPLCEKKSISIIAGGVYNSGVLADPRDGAKFNYDDASAALVASAQRLDVICKAHDVPLKAAAIQFPFTHPAVTAVLTGARSEQEFRENLAMFATPIAPSLWDALRDPQTTVRSGPDS